MRILITGGNGQLGQELQRQLALGESALGFLPDALKNADVISTDLPEVDLTDCAAAKALLQSVRPQVVINCAAFTNVDRCESEPDTAFSANAVAARNVAMACENVGAKLVHLSTDYVFPGTAAQPINETALAGPRSVYGATKLLGEEYVRTFCSRWFVVRTAWLYGRAGNNFVKTMLRIARENKSAKVVNDQFGSPTNAEDLAYHLLLLAASEEYGLYHCTGNGVCSWYELTQEIWRLWNVDAALAPCSTEEFPRPAPRPAYSALDNAMLRATVGDRMRTWQEALAHFYNEMKDNI